ncbi:MAG TPA: hypothetical protein VG265_13670 [Gaiellaceae bacterium]|nr:hypothetical protein [Gaiellaceae bacterium]
MKPRFRQGEIVRVLGASEELALPGSEGLVEETAGPNDEGTGWNVAVRLGGTEGGDSLVLLPETELEPTGMGENERGERTILDDLPQPEEPRNCLELRLFTEITDGIEAARVAETIESDLVELLGGAAIVIEAERHWSEPYNYELSVLVRPLDNPVDALRAIAEAGGRGWIAMRDDGWRCDLWWSATGDEDAVLIVPEVHGAEVAFLPWTSPVRRPQSERPLVAVDVPETLDEPEYVEPENEEPENEEPEAEAEAGPDEDELDD